MSSGTYADFFYDVRLSESGNDYSVVNSLGYLGAYQFGEAALVDLGFVSNDGNAFDNNFNGTFTGKYGVHGVVDFLTSVEAQDGAATEWFDLLWRRIRHLDLEFYDGQTLNGHHLTISGMIAGAHLGGAGGVRDLIESGGFNDPADANGTAITDYIDRFMGYDVPAEFVNNLEKNNAIFGGPGADDLYGHQGDDSLTADAGDDYLVGGAGADLLLGEDGNDILFGDDAVSIDGLLADLGLA